MIAADDAGPILVAGSMLAGALASVAPMSTGRPAGARAGEAVAVDSDGARRAA